MTNSQYLGDGVYAQLGEDGNLVLTTGAHYDSKQFDMKIILDMETLHQLLQYIEREIKE